MNLFRKVISSKNSALKTDFYLNIGLGFLTLFSKPKIQALYLASGTHQSAIILFSSHPCRPFFLRTFQVCTTIVNCSLPLHSIYGCICSYELASSSIINTFSGLSIALVIGTFCKISQSLQPTWLL